MGPGRPVRAALLVPNSPGYAWVFADTEYVLIRTKRANGASGVLEGSPCPIIAHWKSLRTAGSSTVDAMCFHSPTAS